MIERLSSVGAVIALLVIIVAFLIMLGVVPTSAVIIGGCLMGLGLARLL